MIPPLKSPGPNLVYRAVILSPHLDDAVLSCGGRLARWAREGPVLVVNVFTDFSGAPRGAPAALGDVRHREEAAAAAFLGYTSISLGEKDCVCRSRRYLSPGRLFGGVRLREDPLDVERLAGKLRRVLAGLDWRELILPLGVGWHVDHVAVHEASRSFHADERTSFYEDLPYAHIPSLTDRRLAELGHGVSDGSWRAAAREGRRAAAVVATWAPIAGLRPGWVRPAARVATALFFSRLFHRRRGVGLSRRWECRPVDISDAFETKKQACFLYRSQIRAFFTGEDAWEHEARRVPGNGPGPWERVWKLSGPPEGSG